MSSAERYLQGISALIARQQDILPAVNRAAALFADVYERRGLVHVFGSGHSVIAAMDIFPRYGSYPLFHPLLDPHLMWHNVAGPGGAQELLWLERQPGYMEQYLQHEDLTSADALVVVSHGGKNAAPVDTARYAQERGAAVVAITSGPNLARHRTDTPHTPHIADFADIVLDTGAPIEDSLLTVDGWGLVPVAASSTVLVTTIVGMLVAATAEHLAQRGVALPTFVSPTVAGVGPEHNREVFQLYMHRLKEAAARTQD